MSATTIRSIGRLALVTALFSTAGPLMADPPCSFSWNKIRVGNSGGLFQDYTTPIKAQPYQGPCMAFAFAAAMESMYEIEHVAPFSFQAQDISEAWLDYRMWGDNDWKQALETNQLAVAAEGCGNFPPSCDSEASLRATENGGFDPLNYCPVYGQVRPIAQAGDCFNILREFNEDIHQWQYQVSSVSNAGKSWYRAGTVHENLTFQNTDQIKERILDHGPLVLKVDEPANIGKFRDYDTTGVSYHGFSILGWKEVGTCTQWLIKDSWPGMTGVVYTKPDPGIAAMLDSGKAQAWQVADISFQQTTGGTISPAGNQWPSFNEANQCVPPAAMSGSLNCWNAGADKGGCMNAAGALNGFTVSWQLHGTGGTLAGHNERCAEIVGAGFTGTLVGTATDGCGRTVTRSCGFTGGPGPGGPGIF